MANNTSHSSSSELALMRELKPNASETDLFDSFVAVDIDELSQQLMASTNNHSTSSPRVVSVMKKNPSRKGSPGRGAEREKKKTGEGDQQHGTGGPGGAEKSSLAVHVAIDGEVAAVTRATAPTPDGWRWRRVGTRRPPSPWLDPSRVVIAFATLRSIDANGRALAEKFE